MPVKKAAFKALRQDAKRAARNRKVKSDIAALVRHVRKAITTSDQSKAQDWLRQTIKKIDKAVQHGIVKKNTAARIKSRLSRAVRRLAK